MATFQNQGFGATCSNCDLPTREVLPLTRSSIHGRQINLKVCRFCHLQLTREEPPRPEERQVRPWLRAPVTEASS